MSLAKRRPERPPTKLDVQLDLIVSAFREKGIDIGVALFPGGGLDFIYQRGVILVRDAYLGQVRDIVGGGDTGDGFRGGVTLYSLAHAKIRDAIEALAEIDRSLGIGVATPNHILSITPVWPCPATEPEEVPAGLGPDPGPRAAGGGVRIPPYTGHGTFIAGVARCMAPVSTVHVTSDFDTAGALSEYEIVKRLDEALGLGPDIISLSAGATSRKNLPLLSFEVFWERYRHHKGLVMIAAAGNNSTRRPFWPAAFPEVVGVGALGANGRDRAYYSDFGPWVDVYAPGEGLVNAYAAGDYVCREPPDIGQDRVFHGMARWSGTSFSTPLVAGLVAARISRTGENGRRAAKALLARARKQRIPGVGPVLRPGDGDVREHRGVRR